MSSTLRGARPDATDRQGALGLVALILFTAALGAALWMLGGPPSAALRLPDFAYARDALTASEIADRDLIAVTTALAWLALLYLGATVALRLLALAADRLTRGARWARVALQFSTLITIPAVRRVVDGGVAGTLLVASWMPATVRIGVAEEPAVAASIAVAQAERPSPRQDAERAERAQAVAYTVVRGDDLWAIARRFYDDGSRYVEIFEANRDHVMADGERFTDPRVVREGWVLHVPLPSPRIDVEAGTPVYRVIRGDHLWGIAERLLGDGFRWPELWELNRERDMGGGWRFVDPNLIYPGWGIEVPIEILEVAAPSQLDPAPTPPPAPQPSDEPGAIMPTPGGALENDLGASHDEATAEGGGTGIAWDWPSVPRPLLVSAAGFAILGTAVVLMRRAYHAGLLDPPVLRRRVARRSGDAGRVTLVARALADALAAAGLTDARLLLVRETELDLTFTVDCADGAEALAAAAPDLAERLACEVECFVRGPHRAELVLSDAGEPTMRLGEAAPVERALMVPVGSDSTGAIVYLNLPGAGSVSLAGFEADRRLFLHGWLATLGSTSSADELALRADAAAAALIGDDLELPHFGGAGRPETAALLDELGEAVRAREGADRGLPLVAFLDASEAAARADALLPYARDAGVYLVSLMAADADRERDSLFGAKIQLGAGEVAEGTNESALDGGSVLLTIGAGEPLRLDPVFVRRDTSPRWRAGAVATDRDGTRVDSEAELVHDDPGGASSDDVVDAFDWHRAIFEPRTISGGAATLVAPSSRVAQRPDGDAAPAEAPRPNGEAAFDKAHADEDNGGDGEQPPDIERAAPPDGLSATDSAANSAAHESLPHADQSSPGDDGVDQPKASPATGSSKRPRDTELESAGEGATEPEPAHVSGVAGHERSPLVRQQALLPAEWLPRAADGDADSRGDEPVIVATCLGDLDVAVAGTPITHWRYEKGRELVALLAAYGGAAVPRKVIAEALWPDLLWDSAVKRMISNAVSIVRNIVRTATGEEDLQPLTLARDRYQFQPGILRSDLDDFDEGLRRARMLPADAALTEYERALELYRGDLMQSESWEWLGPYRAEYRRRFVEATSDAAALATESGDYERAARLYARGLERAPTDEILTRGLMRSRGALGDSAGVLKAYRVLVEALEREFGSSQVTPSGETHALMRELTRETAAG